MLNAFLILIALQCLGDLIVEATSIPVPGMVIGLMLLGGGLGLRGWCLGASRAVPEALNRSASTLHGHFGLLFVPAGVGVVANLDRIAANGVLLLAVLLISTATTIGITAMIASCGRKAVNAPNATAAAE